MLERGDRGVLQEIVGVGVAVDERACERTQPLELLEHGLRRHLLSIMPPPTRVLARWAA
jgi:hypothetical protein